MKRFRIRVGFQMPVEGVAEEEAMWEVDAPSIRDARRWAHEQLEAMLFETMDTWAVVEPVPPRYRRSA